jgi:hypothetical protein
MHTRELARALHAFAGIADLDCAQELHLLAAFFERGKNETISARIKRATPSVHHPHRLRESLTAIEAGLRAVGAVKAGNALAAVQKLFTGRSDGSAEQFLREISAPPQTPDAFSRRFKSANASLAEGIFAILGSAANDPPSFDARLEELASASPAGTATWTLVANQFIGNRRIYRDRKSAIRAIRSFFENSVIQPGNKASENVRGPAK